MAADEEHRILKKEEANSPLEPQCSPSDMVKIKTLIVEDDHTTQLLYEKGLFEQIFDKKMVASGKEALRVYSEWHPDIIILDIYLPEMTGYQVLKAIRTTIGDKKTTIVMATALSGTEDVQSCMNLGIEGYIAKPFSCSELWVKILGYYAKKEPERARKAVPLCREIAKQSQVNLLLDKDKSKTEQDATGVCNGAMGTEGGGEKNSPTPPPDQTSAGPS